MLFLADGHKISEMSQFHIDTLYRDWSDSKYILDV